MGKSSSKRHSIEQDDLTVIKGIKDARQGILRRALSIHTYDDLAAASVEDVLDAFKAEGQSLTQASVESWQTQASELSGQRKAQTRTPAPKLPRHSDEEWGAQALFVIEFQERRVGADQSREQRVKSHHMETDSTEFFPGHDLSQVMNWIRQYLHDEPSSQPQLVATPEPKPPLSVEPDTAAQLQQTLEHVWEIIGGKPQSGQIMQFGALPESPGPVTNSASNDLDDFQRRKRHYLHKYGGIATTQESSELSTPPPPQRAATVQVEYAESTPKLGGYLAKYGYG